MANRVLAWILVGALGLVAFDAFEQRKDTAGSTTGSSPTTLLDGHIPPPIK